MASWRNKSYIYGILVYKLVFCCLPLHYSICHWIEQHLHSFSEPSLFLNQKAICYVVCHAINRWIIYKLQDLIIISFSYFHTSHMCYQAIKFTIYKMCCLLNAKVCKKPKQWKGLQEMYTKHNLSKQSAISNEQHHGRVHIYSLLKPISQWTKKTWC